MDNFIFITRNPETGVIRFTSSPQAGGKTGGQVMNEGEFQAFLTGLRIANFDIEIRETSDHPAI